MQIAAKNSRRDRLANIELGQEATGVRELREIVKRYPGTEEGRRAGAKRKEMGASLSASQ